jgi:sarcosine oxidase, subunit beta
MGSLEIFKNLQLDLGYDIEFRQSGCLEAIHTEEQYEYARDRVLRLKSEGYALELLTIREARSMEPELSLQLLGCVYTPRRAQAHPVKATRALADAAQSKGAHILTGQEVIAINQSGDDVYRVETRQGEFGAEKLVIAAGAGATQWGSCWGCVFLLCQCGARCGPLKPSLRASFTLYLPLSPACTGTETLGTTLTLPRN